MKPRNEALADVVFTDEWGQHNLRQLMGVGIVWVVIGTASIAVYTQLAPSISAIVRYGVGFVGLAALIIGGVSIYLSATRHRFPFMISRGGLYLPDQVPKSLSQTHGEFVPWEDIGELAIQEDVQKGAKIRVYTVSILLTSGKSKGFGVATHADLVETLRVHRVPRRSAEARI